MDMREHFIIVVGFSCNNSLAFVLAVVKKGIRQPPVCDNGTALFDVAHDEYFKNICRRVGYDE